jgi:hypothetical protein
MTNAISVPLAGTTVCAVGATLGSMQNNICYSASAASNATDFAIWTTIESNNERLKANAGNAGTACPADQGIVFFQYSVGKVQIECLNGTGASTTPLTGTLNTSAGGPYQP